MIDKHIKRLSILVIGLMVVLRLFMLGGDIDIPDWRQADTGYMALRMMDEWPPEMLHPKAPYRGLSDVKAAEYPIYPLAVSLVYRLAGGESFPLARMVTLLFFIGSAVYLGLSAARLFGSNCGWITIALYFLLPLGIPYSRMIHPDFCILFFANGFFYHAIMLLKVGRFKNYALAVVFCSALFLMKAPYGFYYGFPLGLLALSPDVKKSIRDVLLLGSVFVVPLVLGLWFNEYRIQQEAPFEESVTYPMKWTKESLNERFFGTIEQRLEADNWSLLIRRAVILVSTPIGAVLALGGLFFAGSGWRDKKRWLLWFLGGGMLAYTLLVFPMVSSDHDYYSIPYLVFIAVSSACFVDALCRKFTFKYIYVGIIILMAVGSAYGIKRGPFLYHAPYFTRDWQRLETARIIRENTDPDDVVISVTLGRSTGWSDPRILWRANRLGWATEGQYLRSETLSQYVDAGATKAAVLSIPGQPELSDAIPALAGMSTDRYVAENPAGEIIGEILIIDLLKQRQ